MEKRFLTPQETIGAIIANGRRVLAQSLGRTFVLSLLAGFYISFGAQLATVVTSDAAAHLGSGVARLLGGSVFSIGLMLVVICGAELFTGNSFLASSVLDGEISLIKMLENWGVVIIGNLLGAVFFAWMMAESRLWESGNVGVHAVNIATIKCNLPFWVAFLRGVLCNWLVCLAVFMATAARDIPGKILACYVPIMTFVASGFEHSVANMYFIPSGLLIKGVFPAVDPSLTWSNFLLANLVPVTLGNIVGGVLFVALAYWYVHSRPKSEK
ncbi:MAG: FdhC protein [Deltaproteobacteria bacterium HGW-Deltaproteobacteria-4]|nr:MAG: FdhC protein [Deltaproteobacteria bacterium HGW-Deltaproteobacteria-4]